MIHQKITTSAELTHAILVSEDALFAEGVKSAIASTGCMDFQLMPSSIRLADISALKSASVIVVDLDTRIKEDLIALQRLMTMTGGHIPVIAVTEAFDESVARILLQMRVADFLCKPVEPSDIMRSCLKALSAANMEVGHEAKIFTFLPAAGGVGVTTLALETAFILLGQGRKDKPSTCIVDLDFQHGACADYLDIEPRLDLKEIEPRPERLDQQLLEVMLSYHHSGLALVAAPSKPAEMRSFDSLVVTRLLDLVASNFDNVIIDMPRTWFSWTDDVLLGSNNVLIVTEMTVPGLRHAHRLTAAIKDHLGENPKPKVIVNRFEERVFGTGLRKADIENVLGDTLAGLIPNNYRLVREAIDRGVPMSEIKPGNAIATEMRRIILPPKPATSTNTKWSGLKKRLIKK